MNPPDQADCRRSFSSDLCPGCARTKRRKYPLCYGCFVKLAVATQKLLAQPFGQGYEQAIATALTELGATSMAMPSLPGPPIERPGAGFFRRPGKDRRR